MNAPYYQDEWVTLYHGDCLEVAEWLEADVLVTDPPYGVGGSLSLKGRHKNYRPAPSETHAWDADVAARDAAVALWGDRPYAVFGSPRRPDFALPCRQAPLVWDKGDLTGMGDTTFPWRPKPAMPVGGVLIEKGILLERDWNVMDFKTGVETGATGVRIARLCATCKTRHSKVGLEGHAGECGSDEVKEQARLFIANEKRQQEAVRSS